MRAGVFIRAWAAVVGPGAWGRWGAAPSQSALSELEHANACATSSPRAAFGRTWIRSKMRLGLNQFQPWLEQGFSALGHKAGFGAWAPWGRAGRARSVRRHVSMVGARASGRAGRGPGPEPGAQGGPRPQFNTPLSPGPPCNCRCWRGARARCRSGFGVLNPSRKVPVFPNPKSSQPRPRAQVLAWCTDSVPFPNLVFVDALHQARPGFMNTRLGV
jgi:hypothetical protein